MCLRQLQMARRSCDWWDHSTGVRGQAEPIPALECDAVSVGNPAGLTPACGKPPSKQPGAQPERERREDAGQARGACLRGQAEAWQPSQEHAPRCGDRARLGGMPGQGPGRAEEKPDPVRTQGGREPGPEGGCSTVSKQKHRKRPMRLALSVARGVGGVRGDRRVQGAAKRRRLRNGGGGRRKLTALRRWGRGGTIWFHSGFGLLTAPWR